MAAGKKTPSKNSKPKSQTFWGMITEVLIASMNKGQFPIACLTLFGMLMVYRMPPADVSKLVFQLEEHLASMAFTGYLLSFFLGGGWFFHARWQRKVITAEMERIGNEKTLLQEKALSIKTESSQK